MVIPFIISYRNHLSPSLPGSLFLPSRPVNLDRTVNVGFQRLPQSIHITQQQLVHYLRVLVLYLAQGLRGVAAISCEHAGVGIQAVVHIHDLLVAAASDQFRVQHAVMLGEEVEVLFCKIRNALAVFAVGDIQYVLDMLYKILHL